MKPYRDPVRDQMSAVERHTVSSLFRERDFGFDPEELDALFEDPAARALGEVEASIEGALVPPPDLGLLEPPFAPPAEAPLRGPVSSGPPIESEPTGRLWVELKAPLAAMPFFAPDGLALSPYSAHRGGGTGIRNSGTSATTRWCPEARQLVTEETCQDCDKWGDHGDGFEECEYEANARNDTNRGETEDGEDEE